MAETIAANVLSMGVKLTPAGGHIRVRAQRGLPALVHGDPRMGLGWWDALGGRCADLG